MIEPIKKLQKELDRLNVHYTLEELENLTKLELGETTNLTVPLLSHLVRLVHLTLDSVSKKGDLGSLPAKLEFLKLIECYINTDNLRLPPTLKTLILWSNGFIPNGVLKLENFHHLEELEIQENFKLIDVIISNLPKLKKLDLYDNKLKTFSIKTSKNVRFLDLSENKLTNVQLDLPELVELDLSHNRLASVDLKLPKIEELELSGNDMKNITLENFPQLKKLMLDFNNLKTVCLINMNNLEELELGENYLAQVDISNFPRLKTLGLYDNNLKEFEIKNFHYLEELELSENPLAKIQLENLPNLKKLEIKNCKLKKCSLTNFPELKLLDLNSNKNLTEVNFSGLASLTYLYLYDCGIKNLKLSQLPALKVLSLRNNHLETIELESFHQLTDLKLEDCKQLRYVNVRKLKELGYVGINGCDKLEQVLLNEKIFQREGVYTIRFERDPDEKLISMSYFDMDDKYTDHLQKGYAKLIINYDGTGKNQTIKAQELI